MARHVRRGVIIAKIKPGSEDKVAEIFAESDGPTCPRLAGVTHRSLFVLEDVYIHYVEMEEDFEQAVDQVRDHPLFKEISRKLDEHITPYNPETWRSPKDATARRVLHLGFGRQSDARRGSVESRRRRSRARTRGAAACRRGRSERRLGAGRPRLSRARGGERRRGAQPSSGRRSSVSRGTSTRCGRSRPSTAGRARRRTLSTPPPRSPMRSPRTRSPSLELADLALDVGRLDEAASAFQRLRSVDDDPSHEVYAFHGLIEVEIRRENWRRALDLAVDATRVDRPAAPPTSSPTSSRRSSARPTATCRSAAEVDVRARPLARRAPPPAPGGAG